MQEFTTIEFLISYPGMIIAIIMMTQFTKKMFDKIGTNQTKFVVYGWSAVFCIVAAVLIGNFETVQDFMITILVWTVNSVIVWLAAMKAFETTQPDDGTLMIDTSRPDKDIFRLDLGDELSNLGKKTRVSLKVDPSAILPSQE